MQVFDDIFRLWGDFRGLAKAIGEKEDTVYRWQRRGRIPEHAWFLVIDAALLLGKELTIAHMHAANRPMKFRGAHKVKARKSALERTHP